MRPKTTALILSLPAAGEWPGAVTGRTSWAASWRHDRQVGRHAGMVSEVGDGRAARDWEPMARLPLEHRREWKKAEKEVKKEHAELGHSGRFGAGLPPINDGSSLFLQNMIAKMKRGEDGSRIGIVFNGSPLFSGRADSGPSNIRKYIIENDMLEAIVALPDQIFYNTGISTYIWIVTDHKAKDRKGKIQLINASGSKFSDKDNPFFRRMPRSLGDKRKEMGSEHIARATNLYSILAKTTSARFLITKIWSARASIAFDRADGSAAILFDEKVRSEMRRHRHKRE